MEDQVAASSLNIALSTIHFLYRDVLDIELPPLPGLQYARRSEHAPLVFSVFSRAAVRARQIARACLHLEDDLAAGPGFSSDLMLRTPVPGVFNGGSASA